MDQMDLWLGATILGSTIPHGVQPMAQLGAIPMCTVAIQNFNLRVQLHFFAKHLDDRPLLHNAAAQRVFSLKADDQNRIPRIGGSVFQVMQNASRLRHTRSGNDDDRTKRGVQRLRIVHFASVADERKFKKVGRVAHQLFAVVVHFRMHAKHFGRVDRER